MSVKIYSTPTCGYCRMAKNYFNERKIKFTEYNVVSDLRKADEMIHKSGQQGVPVIDINGKIIVGFNKNKLEKLINEN